MEESTQSHLLLVTIHGLKTNEQIRSLQQHLVATLENLKGTQKQLKNTQIQLEESKREIRDLKESVEMIETKISSVQFTVDGYSKYMGTSKTWTTGPEFYTYLARYRMKTNLYFARSLKEVVVELINLPSENDNRLQWPMRCTMTITMFNQAGDDNNLVKTRDLDTKKGCTNDQIRIQHNTIENPPFGVEYLKNDSLKFKIDVRLRD